MKPTREQIAEWVQTANGLDDCLALAYAAGRKAGMEEAAGLCDIEVAYKSAGIFREYAEGYSMGAYVCAHAIRAKLADMEADK